MPLYKPISPHKPFQPYNQYKDITMTLKRLKTPSSVF